MKEYKFKINGNEYNVAVKKVEGKIAEVNVNGVDYSVEMENAPAAAAVAAAPAAAAAPVAAQAPAQAAPAAAPQPAAAAKDVTSPLPGVILSVNVAVGDKVKAGQKVAVLEAMKMENEIFAPKAGTVAQVLVSKGSTVDTGATLVVLN